MATMASNEDATPRWLVGRIPITNMSRDGSRPLTITEAKKLLSSYKDQVTRDVNSGTKSIATWEGVHRSLATYDTTPSLHNQSQDVVKKPRCPNCSSNQHMEGKPCPAKDKTCNICGKIGHFGRTRQGKLICRSAPAETPKALDRGRSQSRGRALTEAPPASEDQASVSSVQLAQ